MGFLFWDFAACMVFIGRAALIQRFAARYTEGSMDMLDLIFIAIGAAFLAVCVLYAFACDRL
jgi:hypothetical protein